jgi:hypothetical protein
MEKLIITTETSTLISLLRKEFREKIQTEWAEKWQEHYGQNSDLNKIAEKGKLYMDLADDISKVLEKALGRSEVIAQNLNFSPDTIKRFVNESNQPTEKTKKIIATYVGYENWEDFVEKHTPKQVKLAYWQKINWKLVRLIGISALVSILLTCAFFYLFILPRDSPMFSYEPNYAFDVHGKDRLNILFTVQLSGQIESNVYRMFPHIDITWLDLCYTPECPSRKRIIEKTEPRSKAGWTMGNVGNPTHYKIFDMRIAKQTADSAVVLTREHWKLTYWDMFNKKYCYNYEETDKQIYYLAKIDNRWKIHLIEHNKGSMNYMVK